MGTLTVMTHDKDAYDAFANYLAPTGQTPEHAAIDLAERIVMDGHTNLDLRFESLEGLLKVNLSIFRPKVPGQMDDAVDMELVYPTSEGLNDRHWHYWRTFALRQICDHMDGNMTLDETVLMLIKIQEHARGFGYKLLLGANGK